MRPWLVAIAGPTASGKSAIALDLARRLGGEIVNADSRQIYRGMDIGTAKPSPAERQLVPHHLFDIANPAAGYSLALYLRDAKAALGDAWARGALPWLVGGTGQYLWGLLEDWQVPEVPPDPALRAGLAAIAAESGPEALHERLAAVDPIAAERIDARNVRRVIRALEVHHHTGIPISTWQQRGTPPFDSLLFGIAVPRDELDRRIDRRVESMFAAGFVDEVRALLDSGVPRDASAMSSIGYGEVARHLAGECRLDEAVEATQRATRRLARRQQQWFRRDDPRITWVQEAGEIERAVTRFAAARTAGSSEPR